MNFRALKIGVIGTTSWGTTLALHLAKIGHEVYLWARTPEEAQQLRHDGENRRFLPGIPFTGSLHVTAEETLLQDATMTIFAVPSKTLRLNVKRFRQHLTTATIIVSATKGLEMTTGFRMSQVLCGELPSAFESRICVLSGPNLSAEIARGLPASTVIASTNTALAQQVQNAFISPQLRVYTNSDVVGVELGGSLKNIIALGAGIADGLELGDNSKSAFITRGLVEITRLGVAAGANPVTFSGLAGLGDLIATTASPLSRNRYVGEQLAHGRSLRDIESTMHNIAEGVGTTVAALKLSADLGIEMPITETTYKVLFEDLTPQSALAELMERAPQAE